MCAQRWMFRHQEKRRSFMWLLKMQQLRDSFELTKECLMQTCAGASEVMVQQDKTGIAEDAVSVVIPGCYIVSCR